MPTKKKKFIDRKNAVTFRLVHRSQKDPLQADETAPKHILLECVPKEKENLEKQKEEQRKYGIYFDDDYDYLQHLKDVDSVNEWEPVLEKIRICCNEPTKENKKEVKIQLPSSVFQSNVEEKVGLLNKAAPVKGPKPEWDPDIVAALDDDFDINDPNNVLEDNFISLANGLASEEELTEGREGDDEMDDVNDISSDEVEFGDDKFFDECRSFTEEETRSRFTNYSLTSSVLPRSEQLQFLDDRFEKMYEQYDDNEIGALDNDEINGYIEPNSEIINQLVEEFNKERQTCAFNNLHLGSDSPESINKIENSSTESEELIEIEENSKEDKWDCESVLSTYSNYNNHPRLIEEPKKNVVKISKRTGLPVDTLAKRGLTKQQLRKLQKAQLSDDDSDDEKSNIKSAIYSHCSLASTVRLKNETPEEKRARKNSVKQQRKERRIEKKCNKLAFKEEKKRQEKVSQNIINNLKSVKLV